MKNGIIRIPAILSPPNTTKIFTSCRTNTDKDLKAKLAKDPTLYNTMKQEIIDQYFPDFIRNANYNFINKQSTDKAPLISFIIPLKCSDKQKRESFLEKILKNIKSQEIPVEIILVEQDGESAKLSCQKLGVRYFNIKGGLFNKARCFNFGVSKSTTDKIILHDADLLIPPDYASRVCTILNSFDCCHIGRRVFQLDENNSKKCCLEDKGLYCSRMILVFEGGSIASTKQHFCKIGGCCENFEGYGYEDAELYERMTLNQKAYLDKEVDFIHLFHNHDADLQNQMRINKDLLSHLRFMSMEERYRLGQEILKKNYPSLLS